MTLPLLANTVTYGLWWQETNQMIGILNQLTDGQLTVNGSLNFTNSQFSLTTPSQNISNTLALTSPSGNSLFLLSSNAVINGTLFITGSSPGLVISNNANINQTLYVTNNIYSQNVTTYATHIANNYLGNTLTVTGNSQFNNTYTNNLVVNTNAIFVNVTTHNIAVIQAANISQGLGVTGGLTADFANLNFISSNNTVQLYAGPSINTAGEIRTTLFNPGSSGQFRAVQSNSAIFLRNDGNNFSILTSGNVANPYTASFNSLIPFQFNTNTGALIIDATGAGTTFNGPITITGAIEHASNIAVAGFLNANGSGNGLYVANSSFLNGSAVANSTFTVNNNLFVNGNGFFNNQLTVTQPAIFQTGIQDLGYLNVNSNSSFNGPVIAGSSLTVNGGINVGSGGAASLFSSGEIQSSGGVAAGGQFRAVDGNFGVIFRNDGTNFNLLQTPSTTTPFATTWNSYRPFSWNLNNGIVSIDAGASGTNIGGFLTVQSGAQFNTNVTIEGQLAIVGTLIPGGPVACQNNLNVDGPVSFFSTLGVSGATILNTTLEVGGIASFDSNLNVNGQLNTGQSAGIGGNLNTSGNLGVGGYVIVGGSQTISGFGTTMNSGSFSSGPVSWTVACSVFSGSGTGMVSGSFSTFSDRRIKDDIEDITLEEGINWVLEGKPKKYSLYGKPAAGFIAQDDIQTSRSIAVAMYPDNDPNFVKGDEFTPDGYKLTRDYLYDIPYLTAALQAALNKIDNLENRLMKLEGII